MEISGFDISSVFFPGKMNKSVLRTEFSEFFERPEYSHPDFCKSREETNGYINNFGFVYIKQGMRRSGEIFQHRACLRNGRFCIARVNR